MRSYLLLGWILILFSPPLLSQKVDTTLFLQQLHNTPDPISRLAMLEKLVGIFQRNDTERALLYAKEALQISQKRRDQQQLARTQMILGNVYWQLGRYDSSLMMALRSLAIYEPAEDSAGIADGLTLWAQVDYRFGNYAQALEYHLDALEIREKHSSPRKQGESWLQMGIVRAEIGNYPEARECYDQALTLARQIGDSLLLADILNHIGRSWRKELKYPEAVRYHQASRSIYAALNDKLGLSDYYNNMGSIYRRQGQYPEALAHFFQALTLQKLLKDQEGLADSYNDIGTTLLQQGKPDSAIFYLNQGLNIARKTGLKDDMRYAYSSLAQAYEKQGNFQQAIATYKRFNEIKDSLFNQETQQQILEMGFREERHQSRLTQAQTELETAQQRQITTWFAAGAAILLMGLVAMFYRSQLQSRLNRNLARSNREIESQRQRNEELLLNILPEETARELMETGSAQTRFYPEVSVLFTDFKGFSKISEQLSAKELVAELDECFRAFDRITAAHNLEKIKTIGDAYMCVGGLPQPNAHHAVDAVKAGMAIQQYMEELKAQRIAANQVYFEARVGIHTGPVVAGVVGIHKFAYDIWGDTVNTAARLETSGDVGRVNISEDTYNRVQTHFICQYRGAIQAKNKGEIEMYFVEWEI